MGRAGTLRLSLGRRPSLLRLVRSLVGLVPLAAFLFLPALIANGQSSSGQNPPSVTPEQRAVDLVRPATAFVWTRFTAYIYDQNNRLLRSEAFAYNQSCSGFIVNPGGYIVTAGHCVDDSMEGVRRYLAKAGVDYLVDQRRLSADLADSAVLAVIQGTLPWRFEGQLAGSPPQREVYVQYGGNEVRPAATMGEFVEAKLIDFKPHSQGDVALLRIEKSNLPAISLASDADIQIGTRVLALGYPEPLRDAGGAIRFTLTAKGGEINGQQQIAPATSFYEVSASLAPGMSGGPAVDLQGRVVGLATAMAGFNRNFIAPSSIARELLSRSGVQNLEGPVTALYREGLERYFRADYEGSINSLTQVLELMPAHQNAQDYKNKAIAAKVSEPPKPVPYKNAKGSLPTQVVVPGIALLLLLAGAGLFLLGRRRAARGGAVSEVAATSTSSPTVSTVLPGDAWAASAANGDGRTGSGTSSLRTGAEPAATGFQVEQEAAEGSVATMAGVEAASNEDCRCPVCGTPHQSGTHFCSECGAKLT